MQVEEWILRQRNESGHAIVGVKDHKNGAQQVAVFALSPEQELVSSSDFLSEPIESCFKGDVDLYCYFLSFSANSGLTFTATK